MQIFLILSQLFVISKERIWKAEGKTKNHLQENTRRLSACFTVDFAGQKGMADILKKCFFFFFLKKNRVPIVAQQKRIQLASMRAWVQSLALLSGFRIWSCCELQCRSQTWLRSGIAVSVAYASSYSSNYTPSLGASICHG